MPTQNEEINGGKYGVGDLWGCDGKILLKISDKRQGSRYKPRETGTDTKDYRHGKFLFHGVINVQEVALTSHQRNRCLRLQTEQVCTSHCNKHMRTRYKRVFGKQYSARRSQTKARGPATNLHVTGVDTADCRCRRYAINTRKTAIHSRITGADSAQVTDRKRKMRE